MNLSTGRSNEMFQSRETLRNQLRDWLLFIRAEGHVFQKYPQLVFQQFRIAF